MVILPESRKHITGSNTATNPWKRPPRRHLSKVWKVKSQQDSCDSQYRLPEQGTAYGSLVSGRTGHISLPNSHCCTPLRDIANQSLELRTFTIHWPGDYRFRLHRALKPYFSSSRFLSCLLNSSGFDPHYRLVHHVRHKRYGYGQSVNPLPFPVIFDLAFLVLPQEVIGALRDTETKPFEFFGILALRVLAISLAVSDSNIGFSYQWGQRMVHCARPYISRIAAYALPTLSRRRHTAAPQEKKIKVKRGPFGDPSHLDREW